MQKLSYAKAKEILGEAAASRLFSAAKEPKAERTRVKFTLEDIKKLEDRLNREGAIAVKRPRQGGGWYFVDLGRVVIKPKKFRRARAAVYPKGSDEAKRHMEMVRSARAVNGHANEHAEPEPTSAT